MNNIYKVIWSKAKNCYVVASEIAKSHTKSASGSEKIGGVTRRSLLASLMALSLLCGGLGVAEATVHVNDGTGVTHEVYTTVETYSRELADAKLDLKADKTDVATNKANIATNADKITKLENDKLDKALASETYATKDALNDLKDTVNGKADKDAVTTALSDKADKADVYSKTGADDKFATKDALNNKADKTYVDTAVAGAVATAGTNVDNKLEDYYNKAEVDGKITAEENARNTAINTAITQERNDRTTAIDTAINGEAIARNQAINTAIEQEKTNRNAAILTAKTELEGKITAEETARTAKDVELEGKITRNSQDIATLDKSSVKYDNPVAKDTITLQGVDGTTITHLKDATLSDSSTDAVTGRQLNKTNENLVAEEKARTAADAEINKKIGSIANNQTEYVKEEQTISQNLTKLDNELKDTNDRTVGITRNDAESKTIIEKSVTVDSKGNVTADGKLKGEGVDAGAGAITTTGAVNAGSLNVTNGATNLQETTVNGELTAEKDATFEKNVTVEKDLTVNGKLNVDKISMKNNELKNGKKHDSATTITADEISNLAKVTEQGNTTESQFTHNEKGTFNYAKDEKSTGEWKRATSNVTADGVSNKMTDSDGNRHTYYQTATESKEQLVNGDKSKSNFEKKTAEENTISITEKDADGNPKSSLTNTQTVNGEKTSVTNNDSSSTIKQEADQIRHNVTSADGKKSSIEVKAEGITNTSKDGTITNDAKDIENNATGDITNTAQNGSIINKAENGNISNTAQNVTNEGTESVTNKVGKNEVKVSKDGVNIKAEDGKKITESVGTASRVVENDKITDEAGNSTVTTENGKGTTFGKEGIADTTNIYGDSIKTGTINARDTTTGKLTAGAAADVDGGRLTVDADGVKGSYKFGKYTSKSYILANTLMSGVDNGKEPTEDGFVGSRTDHYMDGDKAKLDETVKDAAGSNVTNKTSTSTTTTIKDKDGNTTSSEMTSTTITNKAADTIKDKAGDYTVTTNKDNGTTFGKEGSTKTTNIKEDNVTTGTIKATDTITGTLTAGVGEMEEGSRLTVDDNGVKGSVKSDKYTSKSYILKDTLQSGVDNGKDITDNGFVGSRTDHYMDGDKAKLNETVKDADGSNVTKKMSTKTYTEIKDTNGNTLSVNQKADGNNYKLEDQDGNTNHVTNSATQSKQTLKDKDGNTLTTNQTATKNNFDLKSADGSKENHTTNTVDESRVAIKGENGKAELSTTDEGTTFKHSAAKEAFTEGGATNTTIKGNTITTGKVTMDYADVMKDLGVKGNANITGKTTTGSLEVTGTTTTKTLKVTENAEIDGTLKVAKKATFDDSVSIAKDLSVVGDVTANSYKVGDKTYISAAGINANDQKITNVADGSISEGSKDAVNGGQLYTVKNDLEGKVNKVGANAAAMANLHPMEFDPDSKWNIAAAIGNYGSETAAALGAFYRPNDDVMVNLSTAFGTGENMVGGGVSVRLGKGGNKLSREESNALKDQVNDLTARMDALLSVLNPNMSKDFPDVPENHWAYEAVSRLAGNDIVQGYPDGEFHGERTMTRYEMAEIIYNALSRGAEAEKELVEEFKPELQAMAASEKATAERAEG